MIAIFGAPGAGKSEQGALLAKKYGWIWLSYRDILMQFRDKDIIYALEHGMYVDDKVATSIIKRTLDNAKLKIQPIFASDINSPYKRTIILDGFPCDYSQVKWMIDSGEIKDLTGAIILRVPRGELWRRLVARKRIDDTRAAIERRQDFYEQQITGMIKELSKNGVQIREVSGENAPEDVLARISEVLGDWNLVPRKQYAKISSAS